METWRNGTPLTFGDHDSDPETGKQIDLTTQDVLNVDLTPIGIKGYKWPFTVDHAKWGISEKKKERWVIVGDINRQISQDKRGGGALAFQNENLWSMLRQIEIPEKTVAKGAHKEKAN